MSARVYDISNCVGILLIGAGVASWSVAAALVTVGALIIALSVLGAFFSRR